MKKSSCISHIEEKAKQLKRSASQLERRAEGYEKLAKLLEGIIEPDTVVDEVLWSLFEE